MSNVSDDNGDPLSNVFAITATVLFVISLLSIGVFALSSLLRSSTQIWIYGVTDIAAIVCATIALRRNPGWSRPMTILIAAAAVAITPLVMLGLWVLFLTIMMGPNTRWV